MTTTTNDRPDWVHCVLTGRYPDGEHAERKTWCGRQPDAFEFTFVDAGHAALNGATQGRLVCCPQCAAEITKALANRADEGERSTP